MKCLGLEKSLVYFSTSLKSDEVALNKIMRGKQIQLYEEDEDLLEDVMIEIHQPLRCVIFIQIQWQELWIHSQVSFLTI